MPRSKNDNSYRSWSKEECFAHNKNAMAERGLQRALDTIGKERFHAHSKKKTVITEVRETLRPLSLTTGYHHETEKTRMMYNYNNKIERRVKFHDDDDNDDNVEGADEDGECKIDEAPKTANTKQKQTSKRVLDNKLYKTEKSTAHNINILRGKRSQSSIQINDSKRRQSVMINLRPYSCPNLRDLEKENIDKKSKLTSYQIASIDKFYLNKMKQKRRFRNNRYLIDIKENGDTKENCERDMSETCENGTMTRKRNPNSKWALVTIEKVLLLRDKMNQDGSDLALIQSRQLIQMPKLYQVYWSNIERFREMAAAARKGRRKSDVSTIGTDNESGTVGGDIDDADVDSGSDTESLGLRDDVDKRLWRDDNDPEKDGQRRYVSKDKNKFRDKEVIENVIANENKNINNKIDVYLPSSVDEYQQEAKQNSSSSQLSYPKPIYSLTLNSSMKSKSFTNPDKKEEKQSAKSQNLTRQVSFYGSSSGSVFLSRRTDTSRIVRYQQLHDGEDDIPLAQFVRAVENGLSIGNFIQRVADLRVPLSKVIIKREREKMVRSHTPRTVKSDKERERMKEIQQRIQLFLLTLPQQRRTLIS